MKTQVVVFLFLGLLVSSHCSIIGNFINNAKKEIINFKNFLLKDATDLPGPNPRPTTHSEFIKTTAPMNMGYFNDWGYTFFNPNGDLALQRITDFDLINFAFVTLTKNVGIVWGGSGYENGALIDGSWNFTFYDPNTKLFSGYFCGNNNPNQTCSAEQVQCITSFDEKQANLTRIARILKKGNDDKRTMGLSIGGWSDTHETPTTSDQANTLADAIITFITTLNKACPSPIIHAVDFDWEHMSGDNDPQPGHNISAQTRMDRLTSYAQMANKIRDSMPDIIMSFTTRFNAYTNYYQQGASFRSNQEAVTLEQIMKTKFNKQITDIFTYANIMAYDVPPEIITPTGWTIDAYGKILKSFESSWPKNRIFMGVETGQQAADGIYPGYVMTLCLFDFVKSNGYAGISFWAINQYTYYYNTSSTQAQCDFDNENGWPSGENKLEPNCKPTNGTCDYKEYKNSCACMENTSPFMAQKASLIYQGKLKISSQVCSSTTQWLGCSEDKLKSNDKK